MAYLLFILCSYVLLLFTAKYGGNIDDTMWLCLAILTAGEVISWRCKK